MEAAIHPAQHLAMLDKTDWGPRLSQRNWRQPSKTMTSSFRREEIRLWLSGFNLLDTLSVRIIFSCPWFSRRPITEMMQKLVNLQWAGINKLQEKHDFWRRPEQRVTCQAWTPVADEPTGIWIQVFSGSPSGCLWWHQYPGRLFSWWLTPTAAASRAKHQGWDSHNQIFRWQNRRQMFQEDFPILWQLWVRPGVFD